MLMISMRNCTMLMVMLIVFDYVMNDYGELKAWDEEY